MTKHHETLDAEAVEWLRSAAGRWLETSPISLVESGEPAAVDWQAVGDAAGRHNLEPLLFELVESGRLAAPDALLQGWESQYYRNQIFNLSLLETLAELLEMAASAGVRPVVLKGPVSIARRWKDPGLRVMVDIDLLCKQSDLQPLVKAARQLGFRSVGENATYHLSLQHPELGAGLELHFDLYEVLAQRSAFAGEIFGGAERLEAAGCGFWGPTAAADLVLQLAHILHHDQRVDLRHWLDFLLAVRETGEMEERSRLLELTDLEPEFEEASAIARRLFLADAGAGSARSGQTAFGYVEGALMDLTDRRALLAGARMHPGWWARLGYVVRLLLPSPRRWRALAESEGTGIGTALVRHVNRAFARGRTKIERHAETAAPADSPRARLFRRRAVS